MACLLFLEENVIFFWKLNQFGVLFIYVQGNMDYLAIISYKKRYLSVCLPKVAKMGQNWLSNLTGNHLQFKS